ncbi:MAG: GDYXXLXY domain-containing protein [Proteobacteria bacterium]|nr:GDYXXLXY domain-containing protein [Pseudomonadota bacterium]
MSLRLKIILVAIFMAVQAGGYGLIISNNLSLETEGELLYLDVNLRDPYNPVLGRYLYLSHSLTRGTFDRPPESNDIAPGDTVYIVIDKNDKGFFESARLETDKPKSGVYLNSTVRKVYEDKISTNSLLDRYYVQEDFAIEGEEILRDIAREHNTRRMRRDIHELERKTVESADICKCETAQVAGSGDDGVGAVGDDDAVGHQESCEADATQAANESGSTLDKQVADETECAQNAKGTDEHADADADDGVEVNDSAAKQPQADEPPQVWVEMRVLRGKAIITDLNINGKTLEEVITERRLSREEE